MLKLILMRSSLILFAIILIAVNSQAVLGQETVVKKDGANQVVETYKTNADGKRDGPYETNYGSGAKKEKGGYVNGEPEGKWLSYHANGNLQAERTFVNGQLTDTWSEFHENGQLKLRGTAYGNSLGRVTVPLKSGLWTYYFNTGAKEQEGHYEEDLMSGRWLSYYANGKVSLDRTYAGGNLTGTWSEYFDNGQLAVQGTTYGNSLGRPTVPLKTGVWIGYDRTGNVTSARNYVKDELVGEASFSTDTTTGQTTVVAPNPDGTRTKIVVDKNGLVAPPDSAPNGAPAPADTSAADAAGGLVAINTDPATGEIATVRRNPDGTTSTYTGVKRRDADGTERLIETDKDGNRIETAVSPDGTVVVVKSSPGKGETKTTTTPDGRITSVERDPAGNTNTSMLADDGSIITERRNAGGELLGTKIERADGSTELVDTHGNRRRIIRDPDGTTTTIATDRSGNTTTTVIGSKGEVIAREANVIAPREPGRAYFEQTLKGTDWDDLPKSLKSRYADTERSIEENEARRAQDEAENARKKVEEARLAAENAAASEETKRIFDNLKAEQAEADRIAAERQAKVDRRNEIQESYETAANLQREYDDAIKRGDKAEAEKILARQDEHAEKSMTLLQHTPEELQAMEQREDARSRLASQITARAYAAAEEKLASSAASHDTKESVTAVTQYASIGSQTQQSLLAANRGAEREKILAQAKQEELTKALNDPATSAEDRGILQEIQTMAMMQESGASELLAANSRITAAGYALDAALLVSGSGKALQIGGQALKTTATKVGSVVARRTATSGTAGAVGRTTVTLADDAGRTLGMTSKMTAAERATFIESRTSTSMGEVTRIVGRDVLPGPMAPRTALNFTRSELARMHTPGVSLTGAEIVKKAELYAARESARSTLRRAIDRSASDSALAPLQAEFQRLNALIEQARRAGGNLP